MENLNKPENQRKNFNMMNYEGEVENLDLAKDWLEKHLFYPYVEQGEFSIPYLENREFIVDLDSAERNKQSNVKIKLYQMKKKFIEIIKEKTDLICQLEVLVRGFKFKDTKKGIQLLIDSINFSLHYVPYNYIKDIYVNKCTSLLMFGLYLGQYIGSKINIFGEFQTFPIISLFMECAKEAGFGREYIALQANRFPANHYWNYNKIPIIIFNEADLDSACDSAIDAAWSNQGIVEWSADTLLIQEDIFDKLMIKLKDKLNKIKIDSACNKQADYSVPILIDKYEEKLKDIVLQAEEKGIDFYQFNKSNKFYPTLFIGRVYKNNVIKIENNQVPTLTCLAFRTNKEAIAIANNTSNIIAASVWSKNISLVNEISQKLEVGTIWVNSYGLFRPELFFNMSEFNEKVFLKAAKVEKKSIDMEVVIEAEFILTLSSAIKAQKVWAKLGYQERLSKLQRIAVDLYNSGLDTEQKWINTLIHSKKNILNNNNTMIMDNFEIKSYKEPVGVLVIFINIEPDLLIRSLLDGNVVVTPYMDNMLNGVVSFVSRLPSKASTIVADKNDVFMFTGHYYKLKNVWVPVGETYC